MIVTSPKKSFAASTLYNVGNIRLRNEFVTEPLNQRLAYSKDPLGRFCFVEAKKIPIDFFDVTFELADNEPTFKANSITSKIPFKTTILDAKNTISIPSFFTLQQPPCTGLDEDVAEFDILYLESLPFDVNFETTNLFDEAPVSTYTPLDRLRADLQSWFGASVDELAVLLDLSPTTIVNLSKPGRSVRPKTVRKMRAIHGLLRELQRVLGPMAALAWARTSGRRLLEDGDLTAFEQFVNARIFPTVKRKLSGKAHFGSDDAELVLKEGAAIGEASRF